MILIGVLIGNTIEAAADRGGMADALRVLLPANPRLIVFVLGGGVFALQCYGSYTLLRDIFRWLALTLLSYVAAAFMAQPHWREVLRGTLVPHAQGSISPSPPSRRSQSL